jgi:hypothetical protein
MYILPPHYQLPFLWNVGIGTNFKSNYNNTFSIIMQCVIRDWSAAFSGYVLIACIICVMVESFILHQISCSDFGMNEVWSV